jgi:hypothetical protein
MIPFYKQHKEIAAFIEAVDQVLNSNSVFIKQDFSAQDNPTGFMKEAFGSGAFCDWVWGAGEYTKGGREIRNVDLRLQALSFSGFKDILEDMLAVKGKYFHDSPYKVKLAENRVRLLLDDFIEATVNDGQESSHLKRMAEIDAEWSFYTMPREYIHSEDWEKEFLWKEQQDIYRPMAMADLNMDNFLARYFCYLGLDCFLVFHNDQHIYFLLTNGGD